MNRNTLGDGTLVADDDDAIAEADERATQVQVTGSLRRIVVYGTGADPFRRGRAGAAQSDRRRTTRDNECRPP